MQALIHDIRLALKAGLNKWRECRALRAGACPDDVPLEF